MNDQKKTIFEACAVMFIIFISCFNVIDANASNLIAGPYTVTWLQEGKFDETDLAGFVTLNLYGGPSATLPKNRYLLEALFALNMCTTYQGEEACMSFDLQKPGSITLAIDDKKTYFGSYQKIQYKSLDDSNWSDYQLSSSPSTCEKTVIDTIYGTAFGLGGPLGTFLWSAAQLAGACITSSKPPDFMVTSTWNGTSWSWTQWQDYEQSNQTVNQAKPESFFVDDHRLDIQKTTWDKLTDNYYDGSGICYYFDLKWDEAGDAPLYIRLVLPYTWKHIGSGYASDPPPIRYLEIEWSVDLQSSVVEPTPPPDKIPPTVDIKINGSDDNITIPSGAYFTLTTSIDPGDYGGDQAELWIYHQEPDDTGYWCDKNDNCLGLPQPAETINLQTVSAESRVVQRPLTMQGNHTFCVGVDLEPDNTLTTDQLYLDCANIIVSAETAPSVDIKINGSDGPVTVNTGEDYRLTGSVDSGGFHHMARTWTIYYETSSGNYTCWDYSSAAGRYMWLSCESPTKNTHPKELTTAPKDLSPGTYTFCIALDLVCGDDFIVNPLYLDCVELTVTDIKEPTVDIKANASDGPLAVDDKENVLLTFSIDPGDYLGTDADYWMVCVSPDGTTNWLTLSSGWLEWLEDNVTAHPVYSSALASMSTDYGRIELAGYLLWLGTYNCCFGIDLVSDGLLSLDHIYFDCVKWTVNPTVRFTGTVTARLDTGGAVGVAGLNVQVEEVLEGGMQINGNPTWTVTWVVYPPFSDMDIRVGDKVEVYGRYSSADEAPDWWTNTGELIVGLSTSNHYMYVILETLCGTVPNITSFSYQTINGCDAITYEIIQDETPNIFNEVSQHSGSTVRISGARITRSMGDTSAVIHSYDSIEDISNCDECISSVITTNTTTYISSDSKSRSFWAGAGGTTCCGCQIEHYGTLPDNFPDNDISAVTFYLSGSRENSYYDNVMSGNTTLSLDLNGHSSIAVSKEVEAGMQLPEGLDVPWFITFNFDPPVDIIPGVTQWKLLDGDNNIYSAVLLHMSDMNQGGLPGTLHQYGCQYTEDMDAWYSVKFDLQ